MNDVNETMKRQAAWQRSRAKTTWAEKINCAARIRNDILRLRENRSSCRPDKPMAKNGMR